MEKSDIERIHAILYSDFWDYVFGSSGTSPGLTCCKDPSIKPPQASKATHNLSTFLHWTLSNSIQKISISGMDIADIYKQINHFTNGTIVDFLAPGISKASGVKNILSLLSIRPEETAFVFNDANDLSVIEAPALRGMHLIKVGSTLPNIPAHATVANPNGVASVLSDWLTAA